MLTELRIKNFAIIDHIELQFTPGLIIFTGETGAGKSIILDALNTLLGSRADSTFIRTGEDKALIEATFHIPDVARDTVHEILRTQELLEDPEYLILSRELRRQGPNIARVNGHVANVSILKELGEFLIDIHGQSEHLSLLKVNQHIHLLDRFANLDDTLKTYQQYHRQLKKVQKELQALKQSEQEIARKIDLLTYQINEISAANLSPGEEEDLKEERNRLANAEGLASACQEVLTLMEEGTPEIPSISDLLGEVLGAIHTIAKLDPAQEKIYQDAITLSDNIQELNAHIQSYLENVEFNPRRLAQVEDRLNLIHNLKRKYGNSIEDILAFAKKAQSELDTITHAEERIATLQEEVAQIKAKLTKLGMELAEKRHQAAKLLEEAIEKELDDLNMPSARFMVSFAMQEDENGLPLPDGRHVHFDQYGIERVEFMVETNPGEGYKPLVKIASGGETSRFMLALKNVLAQADHIPTLIFDEIDQGIGGRIGSTVGFKLWNLARQHQVICITHLPQLAAYAHKHYLVNKQIADNRTITTVRKLDEEKRIRELAQMIGGINESNLQAARALLEEVKEKTERYKA